MYFASISPLFLLAPSWKNALGSTELYAKSIGRGCHTCTQMDHAPTFKGGKIELLWDNSMQGYYVPVKDQNPTSIIEGAENTLKNVYCWKLNH